MEPNYLKTAIEETPEEKLTQHEWEESIEESIDVVDSDPSDYEDEEYYEDEDEYREDYSCIGTGAWEDFVYCRDTFQQHMEDKILHNWDQWSPSTQHILSIKLGNISTLVSEIYDRSQYYET